MQLSLSDGVRRWLRPGALRLDDVHVGEHHAETWEAIEQLGRTLREDYRRQDLLEVPGVAAVRAVYRGFGIDPTKTRPSSEALLRRLLGGRELYRVNAAVDVGNLISLRHGVPLGLYDADALTPPVTLRVGREGEGYKGIGKDRIRIDGRPALFDERGPFGNPSADSARTRVTGSTRRLLLVLYEPADRSPGEIDAHLDDAEAALVAAVGGRTHDKGVIET